MHGSVVLPKLTITHCVRLTVELQFATKRTLHFDISKFSDPRFCHCNLKVTPNKIFPKNVLVGCETYTSGRRAHFNVKVNDIFIQDYKLKVISEANLLTLNILPGLEHCLS